MTDADKKLLTDFLGEKYYSSYPLNQHNLDFTDWRVVGRLIDQCCATVSTPIFLWTRQQRYVARIQVKNNSAHKRSGFTAEGSTPQEAICAAVVAYLGQQL